MKKHSSCTAFCIALIILLWSSFFIRHAAQFPEQLSSVPVQIYAYDYFGTWTNIIRSNTSLHTTDNVITDSSPMQALAFAVITAIGHCIRKNRVEYCGKKMIRAIMLQWRPN